MPTPVFHIPFRVRSYELDSLGHLNNAVYFSYMEEATFAYLAQQELPFKTFEAKRWFPIIAHAEVDFRREVYAGDDIDVCGWPERYGNTSLTLRYQFRRAGEVVADGMRVWVFVHRDDGKLPVPAEIRGAFGPAQPTE